MKRSSVAFVLSVLLLALLPRESFAVITIYIHPNGAGANAVFEISGQFDNPNAMDSPTGLSSFAIAPLSMWRGPYPNNYTFASPLATVYNVTRNTSGDISMFNAYENYCYLSFPLNASLPTLVPGDVLTLQSHGPQSMTTLLPYAYFVPGDYTFTNPGLGPTTFEVHVVPEPSSLAMAGVGLAGWAGLRRRLIKRH